MQHLFSHHLRKLLRWTERHVKIGLVSFAKGNLWLLGGRVVAVACGMVLTYLFANLLDQATFGTYKYVLASAAVIGAFSLNGMNGAVLRAAAQGKESTVPSAVRRTFIWSLPASVLALGVSLYYFSADNSILGFGFLFIAFTNALMNATGLAKAVLLGVGDFRAHALSSFPRNVVPILVVGASLLVTKNLVIILLAYFASNALSAWVLQYWTLRRLRIKASDEHTHETIRLGKHLSVLGFFMLLSSQLDHLLLWHFVGPAAVAVYALAIAPVLQVRTLLDNFLTVAFPKLASKSRSEVAQTLSLRVRQLFLVSGVTALLYLAMVPYLFQILFPQYLESVTYTYVLALIILLQPRGLFDSLLLVEGDVRKRYRVVIGTQVFRILLLFLLIPFYGIWGAVIATAVAEAATALAFALAYRSVRLRVS